jgi:hypothetical protein
MEPAPDREQARNKQQTEKTLEIKRRWAGSQSRKKKSAKQTEPKNKSIE